MTRPRPIYVRRNHTPRRRYINWRALEDEDWLLRVLVVAVGVAFVAILFREAMRLL